MSHAAQLAEVLRQAPRNCWLALDEKETRVVAYAPTPEEAERLALQSGVKEPLLIWAPEKWTARIF